MKSIYLQSSRNAPFFSENFLLNISDLAKWLLGCHTHLKILQGIFQVIFFEQK